MPLGVSEKFLRDEGLEEIIGDLAGAEGVDQNADRLGDADGVSELNFDAAGEAGGDEVLGNVTGHVGGRTVDLGGVLAGEGAAAVTAHAAVGVDDDLAASEAGVAHGPADDEAAGWVDVVLGVGVEELGGDDSLDDVLEDFCAELGRCRLLLRVGSR